MPSIDDYMGMTAVGVTPTYIAEMARAGYRPTDSKRFIEFAPRKNRPLEPPFDSLTSELVS